MMQEKLSAACHLTVQEVWSIICANTKIKTAKLKPKAFGIFTKFAPAKYFYNMVQ